jgi:hypothetical protein
LRCLGDEHGSRFNSENCCFLCQGTSSTLLRYWRDKSTFLRR